MGVKTMKHLRSLIAVGAFALVFMALPSIASAQWGGIFGNGGYGNGQYNNLRGTVMSLQNHARNLDRQISGTNNRRDDRYGGYGNDRYGNDRYGRNDRYNSLDRLASQFKNAAENLADEVGRGRNIGNSRDEAQQVLALGSQLDRELSVNRSGRGGYNNDRGYIMNEWNQIERDMQTIARAYGLRYQNQNGGWRDKLPF